MCVRWGQAVGTGEKGRWTIRGTLRGCRGTVGMMWNCFRDMNTWATSECVSNTGPGVWEGGELLFMGLGA